jgi:hypothetical protein
MIRCRSDITDIFESYKPGEYGRYVPSENDKGDPGQVLMLFIALGDKETEKTDTILYYDFDMSLFTDMLEPIF